MMGLALFGILGRISGMEREMEGENKAGSGEERWGGGGKGTAEEKEVRRGIKRYTDLTDRRPAI